MNKSYEEKVKHRTHRPYPNQDTSKVSPNGKVEPGKIENVIEYLINKYGTVNPDPVVREKLEQKQREAARR
jgi:hypothetical protein